MTMPCRWDAGGLGPFVGRVRFRRAFGAPTRVDAHEHLWLTFAGADQTAEVSLNGQLLGRHAGPGPFGFEVTGLIRHRNTLQVDVESAAEDGGLWGEVALEVRCQETHHRATEDTEKTEKN
jgi:beta-galactosidase/beta-glucuronidase